MTRCRVPFLRGCLFRGALCLIAGTIIIGTVHAANPTNDPVCTTNANGVVQRIAPLPESTQRMIERLERIHRDADPRADDFMNVERVKMFEARISSAPDARTKALLGLDLVQELIKTGQSEEALKQLEISEEIITNIGIPLNADRRGRLRMLKATALLRIGEQENCLDMHNAESCLFPLAPAAFHKLPRGSQGAIVVLAEQLKEDPQDLSARWLLNLAYMTLGEYPDKVPAEWLIPPKTFQSDCDFSRFTDVAGPLGLDVNGLAGGVILDDFDNDGLIDIVSSSWGFEGVMHYFHNDGDGHFSDRTAAAGLSGLMGGLNIQQTDYNNDGLLDVWVLRGAWAGKQGRVPPSLLRNNGDGTFTERSTAEAVLAAIRCARKLDLATPQKSRRLKSSGRLLAFVRR
jgi:hypothetical protein